jgi:iron complex outermembrane recepter protein
MAFRSTMWLALALASASPAQAQNAPQTITITGSSASNSASLAGFGKVPLARSPFSASVISTTQMQDAGISSLADITRLDAGITDAYNAPGYWGQLAVRGFTLDNRFNYRRDGLPINAETVLPTANKAALELMKGTSGIQAGTSAPGGLLNLVVKRPTALPLRAAAIEWVQPGSWTLQTDLSDRAGADGAFGWRINAQASRLRPMTRNSQGSSQLLAAAVELKIAAGHLLEAEFESSRQSQPSTPGFSLLGSQLPAPSSIDPRLNLNNQAWSLPVVLQGRSGSLRYTHELAPDIQVVAHWMQQNLRNDDRVAFPSGCSSESDYTRYCSDGSFDLYDFRSEGERRSTRAADLSLQGSSNLGGLQHHWRAGVLATRDQARFNRQAYNYVGVGRIDGSAQLPPDPTLTDENTQRNERSTELHLRDRIDIADTWQLWAGARHTRLTRASVRTDGSRPTDYDQGITTPWLALAWLPTAQDMAYLSAGQGVESEVAPNRARYSNAGQALPALKSTQFEAGYKHRSDWLQWQLALFSIRRPAFSDIQLSTQLPSDACSDSGPCERRADGAARHQGVEAEAEWRLGDVSLRASALALKARRIDAADARSSGFQPTNVPERSVKLQAAWNLSALPGLALLGFVSHEGERAVLPDNSVFTAGWTRMDLGLRYAALVQDAQLTLRAGVDNVANTRAWKESPYQFGHAYLYPLLPRTWRLALNVTL